MKEYKNKTFEGNHPRILVTREFVERNKFSLNRSLEEITEKIESKKEDLFSHALEVLINYLPWEQAKHFYKEDFVKKVDSGAEEYTYITDLYETVQDMLDYLIFGYMKALDERGISASRTIDKLSTWFWLLGREDLKAIVDDGDLYNPYGMPALLKATEMMGLTLPEDCVEFSKKKCI